MSTHIIKSWEDLQAQVGNILSVIDKNPVLAIAAASNPLYALEEMGYQLDPGMIDNAEDRMRFKTREVVRLEKLRQEVQQLAGRKFQLRSPSELKMVLEDELGLHAYDAHGCPVKFPTTSYQKAIQGPQPEDPLKQYEGMHPVIAPLLEFRQLDASVHGFCSIEVYRKIREGKTSLPRTLEIQPRLKSEGGTKKPLKKDL